MKRCKSEYQSEDGPQTCVLPSKHKGCHKTGAFRQGRRGAWLWVCWSKRNPYKK